MVRETRSLKINPVIWKQMKIYCAMKDIDMCEYLEKLIEGDLKKHDKI